jgi:hypothetical protein
MHKSKAKRLLHINFYANTLFFDANARALLKTAILRIEIIIKGVGIIIFIGFGDCCTFESTIKRT